MSKNKEFSSTSASRYSLALYELAEEANLLSQIEENSVAYLNLIDQSKEFNSFLKDPTLGQNILTDINNKISNNFNLEILFRRKKDIAVADSVLYLMKTRQMIENFNKKALYVLIREMTGSNTQHITRVINVIKKHYATLHKEYNTTGTLSYKNSGSFNI